jgi:Tol biopolymer transport system component
LTDGGSEEAPTWDAESKRIVYVGGENANFSLFQISVRSNEAPETLWKGPRIRQPSYAQDEILFGEFDPGRPRLVALSLANRTIRDLHPGAEPQVSPDGRWMIYTQSSGHPFRPDVYLESYPALGGRLQVSRNGGAQGAWSRDGKEILFIAPDKKMMVVKFDAKNQSVSSPEMLFQTRIVAPNYVSRQYDVTADGRFLINSLPEGSAAPVTLVTNLLREKQ